MSIRLTRRALVAGGLALGVAAATGACGAGTPSTTGPTAQSGKPTAAVRPAYIPFDGPRPDLMGDGAAGVPSGFLSYPDPPPSTGRVPLKLSAPVEVMFQGALPPVPRGENQWWKQAEEDLGTTLSLNPAASTDYLAKFQTAVAGGAISEITQIVRVPQMKAMLEKTFTDLTPYLSGDNIKKYPNLANTPSAAWDMCIIGGKVWGVTNPRIIGGTVLLTRGELLEAKGIKRSPELANGEDFIDMCRELTDRARGIFAIGQIPQTWTVPLLVESMGGPNGWSVKNDVWTSAYESPEFAQALETVAKMWKEGLFHPGTFTDTSATLGWFTSGTTSLFAQNFPTWAGFASKPNGQVGGTDMPVGVVVMPKWDGGGVAVKHLGVPGYIDPVGLRKTDDAKRIDELLRFADYMASPFGTREYLRANHGVEGRQYRLEGKQIRAIPKAPQEWVLPTYFGSMNAVNIYTQGKDDATREIFAYCQKMIPSGVRNPQYGRFSDTALSKGAVADRALNDVMSNVVQGRGTMNDWEGAVKAWKTAAGDAIAREYADQ